MDTTSAEYDLETGRKGRQRVPPRKVGRTTLQLPRTAMNRLLVVSLSQELHFRRDWDGHGAWRRGSARPLFKRDRQRPLGARERRKDVLRPAEAHA